MKQLLAFCETEAVWMRSTVEALVRLESPTTDKSAADRCAAELARRLAAIGAAVHQTPSATAGNHLLAEFAGSGPRVLLLGHYDTVWPVGQLAAMPLVERDGCLFGPGIFDMKAGIAVGMLAVRALHESRGRRCLPRIAVLLTSDEETGSGTSRPLIEEQARQSAAVLVLEPSLPGGALKTSRKGSGQFRLEVAGLAAHAGIEPDKGANAILELARQVLDIERTQDRSAGTTLTVTLIRGGTRANVVPAHAAATVDARVSTSAEAARVARSMAELAARRPGTTLAVSGGFDRPPFERTPGVARLFAAARRVAHGLGFELAEGATGGASDGNITASLGVPTLDGLGAVGDGAHAAHEHVVIDALPARAALLAGLMADIAARRGTPRRPGEIARRRVEGIIEA